MTGQIVEIDAQTLRQWLYDGAEIALLDVREHGQIGEGHILFSAPLPYSRFELGLPALAPNPDVRLVLCDGGDGVAERAAEAARAMGYEHVHVLDGGVVSWQAAGHTLYKGVNVPSKAFGELIEMFAHTPRKSAEEIAGLHESGADMVIVDGRPMTEYTKMNIPGATCCPNGELALRIKALAPDPATTVVVNCAGRTRSIIGAQTLIDLGLPNPVFALENGTQGWTLSGLALENGNVCGLPREAPALDCEAAMAHATRHGVELLCPAQVSDALAGDGTVYLLDVRDESDLAGDLPKLVDLRDRLAIAHAPGGQLVQATDQWIGVRNARVVVLDTEGIRAPVTAAWLRRLGHRASVVRGGLPALTEMPNTRVLPKARLRGVPRISPWKLSQVLERFTILDLRASSAYRSANLPSAVWTTRARIEAAAQPGNIVLVAEDDHVAALAATDLRAAGYRSVSILAGGMRTWIQGGHPVEATPDLPADEDRIDHLFFTDGRHEGDREASLAYLSWEVGLVDQLDVDERAVFKIED